MRYKAPIAAALMAALLLAGCSPKEESPSEPAKSAGSISVSAASSSQPGDSSSQEEEPSSEVPATSDGSSQPGDSSSQEEGPSWEVPVTSDGVSPGVDVLTAAVDQADWSWFDDAVIIGDSVSLKLKNYVTARRQEEPGFFGAGQFLTAGSLGSGNALWEVSDKSVHPTFQGTKMLLEESIPQTGAKKIYMMLGINDIAVYGIEGAVENYTTLLDRIEAAAPGVEFYIQSATPICKGREKGALTNANLEKYNEKLRAMCQERGVHYIDVAQVLRDQEGFLPREYCSDPDNMGIHLTDVACKIWLGYLLEDAKLIQGI